MQWQSESFILAWAEAKIFGFVCDLPLVCAFSKTMILCIRAHWSRGRALGPPVASWDIVIKLEEHSRINRNSFFNLRGIAIIYCIVNTDIVLHLLTNYYLVFVDLLSFFF
jgi:hypothetical protein